MWAVASSYQPFLCAIVAAEELFFRHSLLAEYFVASSITRSFVQYPFGFMALVMCNVNSASHPTLLAAEYEPFPDLAHSAMVLYFWASLLTSS